MTIFIRDKKNNSILSLDVGVQAREDKSKFVELSSVVDVEYYSRFLLNNLDIKNEIISDFQELSELRGWLWESYFMTGKNIGSEEQYSDVLSKLKEMVKEVVTKYCLYYTED
jgi:hypothetical protein|tara:strand:+ start:5828 stop:6163 length:336 start_codon:yes stop_codon:yes gene_type:complete